ncbi:MAG: glycoside hydrolase family 3 C-terminal domain-containing protein [Actinomycetota bacterium]
MTDTAPTAGTDPSAHALVAQMTTEEKVALLSGSDVWRTAAVERLGIPPIKVSDGPNGVRGDSTTGVRALCLPASIALGASFDRSLVTELGRLLGRETLRKGAHVLLAPTINLARHPLGGRNFESFGEEPTLTAALAVAYVQGVQDEGVGACAKHLVANDVEEARLTVSSQVDDRTLREVYLRPFEAVAEAGVWSMMAAYPRLNGTHCTEHPWLLTELLRREWGWDGLVMSDWGATHHPTASVLAGLDLEMPGPARALGPKLLAAVEAGEVPMPVLDARAARVVELSVRSGRLGVAEEPERSIDLPEERALIRRAAAAGTVLLTNRSIGDTGDAGDAGPVLPLRPDIGTVAVIGPNADPGVIQGGGSAQLSPLEVSSPVAGLRATLGAERMVHRPGCLGDRYLPAVPAERWVPVDGADGPGRPLRLEVFRSTDLTGDPAVVGSARRPGAFHQGGHRDLDLATEWSQRWTGRLAITESGIHSFGVLAVGRSRVVVDGALVADNWNPTEKGQAFFDRSSTEVVGQVELAAGDEVEVVVEWAAVGDDTLTGCRFGYRAPFDEDAMMADAVAAAAEAEVAVVVVGLNADWETESFDRASFGLPGRQDELIRRVATANPATVVVVNAGGPVDLPWLDDVAATLMVWYPGQAFGDALADVLCGLVDPGGRLPVTFPTSLARTPTAGLVPGDGHRLDYGEGVFVGHRWYHENDERPRLPFGHGLSYASFRLGQPSLRPAGDDRGPLVTVPVTNTADRAGTCVIQVYLSPDPALADAPRVLAGFVSAHLDAGADADLTITVDPHALRRWDIGGQAWRPLAGTHRLEIATSALDVVHAIELTV